ncbi:MAG: hypothetical protein ACI93N_001395 [Flavobacteriaceae bacterium]|jgi:hypothetical protein
MLLELWLKAKVVTSFFKNVMKHSFYEATIVEH